MSFVELQRTNTVLYCEKFSQSLEFYNSLLGLDIAYRNDWFVEFKLTNKSFLSIVDVKKSRYEVSHPKQITLTWKVRELNSVYDYLVLSCANPTKITQKFGASVFYIKDPDGHRIENWSEAK